jgi:hypothetical protein
MLLLVGVLSGCVETTQQKNARVALRDERLLASRSAVRVTRSDPNVTVLAVRMLRRPAGTAIAVTLRNDSSRPVSDLPISVGVTTPAGRTSYLDQQPELPYFQTHIAGVGAGALATWAFSSTRPAPSGRAFARVGASAVASDKAATSLPAIVSSVTSVRPSRSDHAIVTAVVTNRSRVSQDGLEVYAYALSGDRLIAAGAAPLDSLDGEAKKSLQIPLLGDPGAGAVHLVIPPTNFQ